MTDVDRIIARAEEFRTAEITIFRAALRDAIEQALSARVLTDNGMSDDNRKVAYSAAAKLRELGYAWAGEEWSAAPQPPAQREWVGLTEDDFCKEFTRRGDDEGQGLHPYWKDAFRNGANWADAKLREKNTGGGK